MANNKSAEKRNLQTLVRNERNRAVRSTLRTAIKKLRAAVEAGDADAAKTLLPETISVIDVTARKNVIHDNTASRYKSRLSRAVAALG
jgi:small subunit ribosomal protein S20